MIIEMISIYGPLRTKLYFVFFKHKDAIFLLKRQNPSIYYKSLTIIHWKTVTLLFQAAGNWESFKSTQPFTLM